MALFKLRKKVDEPMAAAAPAESIEALRRRARHRLIGAVVLVLVAVVGFPLLFDTQPRPVAVDIPIEIPDRNKVAPLPLPPQASSAIAAGKVTPVPVPAPTPVAETKAEPAPAVEKAEAKPAPAEKVARSEPAEKATKAEPAEKSEKSAKAEPADKSRYVVQVGAFAEKDKARQAQLKLQRAGLRNYTHVAETKNGPRIRVRAGPFASRAEADKAAEKIKGLDLPAAILTL
jgi:DedD protein